MKKKKLVISVIIVADIFIGAQFLSDRRIEQPFVISTIDINEATFVRDVLNGNPSLAGTFEVEPGQKETKVTFTEPAKPESEVALRESMKQIKKELTKHRGRTANELVFIFPEAEIRE